MKITMIDPPDGWRYGFPKECPPEGFDLSTEKFNAWLLEQGYPKKLIDVFEGKVPCRYWYEEILDKV